MSEATHQPRLQQQTRMLSAERSLAGFLLTGFLVLVALVVVAERAGLPEVMAQSAMVLLLVVFGLTTIATARTADEAAFLGRLPDCKPVSSGLMLGVVLTGTGMTLLRPDTAGALMAIVAGQCVGVVMAHLAARWQWRQAGRAGQILHVRSPSVAVVCGLLESVAGIALSAGCLSLIVAGIAPALVAAGISVSTVSLSLLVVLLPALAVAMGGLRTCLALLFGFSCLIAVGYGLMLAVGLASLGSLPLPGFSEISTLTAISEAKTRWFQTPVYPVVLTVWPSLTEVVGEDNRTWFLGSVALAFSIALLFAPAIPLRRRSIVGPALASGIMLPLAMIAVAGYAIEAAGFQFVGASVQRPPAGLLEASRNGFITLCNATPASAEALRLACGASPRESMALGWEQIRIAPQFLQGGLLAALDYPAALGFLARVAEALVLMSGLAAGFWIAARGLGLRMLARDKMAAGLASLRLGLVRLAALLLAVALIVATMQFTLPVHLLWILSAVSAFSAVLIALVMGRSAHPAGSLQPTDSEQLASSGKSLSVRTGKRVASTAGDAL